MSNHFIESLYFGRGNNFSGCNDAEFGIPWLFSYGLFFISFFCIKCNKGRGVEEEHRSEISQTLMLLPVSFCASILPTLKRAFLHASLTCLVPNNYKASFDGCCSSCCHVECFLFFDFRYPITINTALENETKETTAAIMQTAALRFVIMASVSWTLTRYWAMVFLWTLPFTASTVSHLYSPASE